MFLPEPPPSDAAATLYADDRADTGYVDNLTRLWCWRPEVLTAFTDVRTLLLSKSRLSATDIAVIVTATANARADSYCALAWGRRLTAEIGEDAAEQLLRGSTGGLAARHVALARWAHRVAVEPNTTTPDDVAGLRSVGFDDLQIFEATVLVAMRLAFSTVNDALGAEPDAQLAAAAPAAVRAAVSFGRPAASAPST